MGGYGLIVYSKFLNSSCTTSRLFHNPVLVILGLFLVKCCPHVASYLVAAKKINSPYFNFTFHNLKNLYCSYIK